MITVLIADNQTLTRAGTVAVLATAKDIRIVGQATTLPELSQLVVDFQPDVLLTDIHFDTQFTLEILEPIRAQFPLIRVLVLSNRSSRSDIVDVMNQGVTSYISKECNPDELINAVYATANGNKFFCKRTSELLWRSQLAPAPAGEVPALSTRETEIINLIVAGKTNKEIAEKLFLSIHTIRTHRKNIIKKLGFTFKNAAELIVIINYLNEMFI
jgi:DNA-binding NarL/FixJ family response regulator